MDATNGSLGVIFDMDGVLIDNSWAHCQAWFDLAEHEGFAMSEAFFNDTFGLQNVTILPMLSPGISAEGIERLSQWKEQRYRELVASGVELAPGAQALLQNLKDRGFRMAIGSSAPKENLDVFWDRLDLPRYFSARVTKEQVTQGKPSPQTFLLAAELLSLAPNRCAVVEDAVHGIEAAKAAGMPVVAVTSTRKAEELTLADRVVDSLTEVGADDFAALLDSNR